MTFEHCACCGRDALHTQPVLFAEEHIPYRLCPLCFLCRAECDTTGCCHYLVYPDPVECPDGCIFCLEESDEDSDL